MDLLRADRWILVGLGPDRAPNTDPIDFYPGYHPLLFIGLYFEPTAETPDYFNELIEFVKEIRFERLGCFAYSREEATTAYDLGDPVPAKEKQRRVRELMAVQEQISLQHNMELVDTTLTVLVDRIEDGTAYARTEWDTPEVDNEVIIQHASPGFSTINLHAGQFYQVKITDAEAYDLFGSIERPGSM